MDSILAKLASQIDLQSSGHDIRLGWAAVEYVATHGGLESSQTRLQEKVSTTEGTLRLLKNGIQRGVTHFSSCSGSTSFISQTVVPYLKPDVDPKGRRRNLPDTSLNTHIITWRGGISRA
jgi:hypothetical protein